MRRPLIIGNKNFQTKKAAKEFYSKILNSYDFGKSLSDEHYNDMMDLMDFYYTTIENNTISLNEKIIENEHDDLELNRDDFYIRDIRIARFQFNTKCFELVPSFGEPEIISYRYFIDNHQVTNMSVFIRVCRNTIQDDLIKLKQDFFKKNSKNSMAPCQESKRFFAFEDLVVDHRQPNTLSVIIDRFIEVNKIDIDKVEYTINPNKLTDFKDENLKNTFRIYHKDKALLRIVDKNLNASRSGLARLKQMKDDLRI
jgi:hypothetical protein